MNCKLVHSSEDDPIVFPNKPGEGHQHDFYGGDPALPDFSSVTYSQLRSARTGRRSPGPQAGVVVVWPWRAAETDHADGLHPDPHRQSDGPRLVPTVLGATRSCGSPYCLHADFINAWDQDRLVELVRECLVPDVNCNMLIAASDA